MIRVVTAILITLFLAGCAGWGGQTSLERTEHTPLWTYETDPFACLAIHGTC